MHFYQRFNVYICLYLDYNIVNLFHNTLSNPIRLFFLIKYSALLSHFKSKLKVGQKIVFFFVVGMFFDYFCCISVFWQLSIFFSLPCLLNWTPHQVHKQASWLFLCRSKKKWLEDRSNCIRWNSFVFVQWLRKESRVTADLTGWGFFSISIMAKALKVKFFFMIIYEFHNFI